MLKPVNKFCPLNHAQNILYNPDYRCKPHRLREFNISDRNISTYFGPVSPEFQALSEVYNWKSIEIKSYLGTRDYSKVESILTLLNKNLIFPYLSLRNLNLTEKIRIILPKVAPELNETIKHIFSFFNVGFIYEIEGEYYIHGFPNEVKFDNGLMIKLYLPHSRFDEFYRIFASIFQYLEIKHHIILQDLINGQELLKSIYGNLDFLKSYNPLKNLIWNGKDKIWMNHKLFTGKFEKLYPSLILDNDFTS